MFLIMFLKCVWFVALRALLALSYLESLVVKVSSLFFFKIFFFVFWLSRCYVLPSSIQFIKSAPLSHAAFLTRTPSPFPYFYCSSPLMSI